MVGQGSGDNDLLALFGGAIGTLAAGIAYLGKRALSRSDKIEERTNELEAENARLREENATLRERLKRYEHDGNQTG